jgi:CoA:oxalate CoA-transferase
VLNRNKQSLTVNLKAAAGIIRKLAADADVLLKVFRPGVMERLGLGADAMMKLNPRLICCSISVARHSSRR